MTMYQARLPAAVQRQVTSELVDEAVADLLDGAMHLFDASREYDLLLPSGTRLAPKAVFGLALGKVIGRAARPEDFAAGRGQPCFEILEEAGYPIVAKDVVLPIGEADDERVWAEGSKRLVLHLRHERAPGLAAAKRRHFCRVHGKLFCERCALVPSQTLGPHGDACIEVHHRAVAIADMGDTSMTRLADLQCLCANCHRIVHRELAADNPAPIPD